MGVKWLRGREFGGSEHGESVPIVECEAGVDALPLATRMET